MYDKTSHEGALWENLLWAVINPNKSLMNNQDNKPLGSDSNIDQTPQQAEELIMGSQEEEREEGIYKKHKGNNEAQDEKVGVGGGGGGGDELEDQEAITHMLMERQRRRKMKDMFSELHVLLYGPHPAKADKSTIIDEAVSKIKSLEEEIKIKEKQKEESLKQKNQTASNTNISREAFLANQVASTPITSIDVGAVTGTGSSSSYSNGPIMFQTWNFMNVVLSICGNEAQYFVCSSKKQLGLMSSIIFVFEKYGVDVISANLSTHGNKRTYTFQARLTGISHKVGNSLPVVVELFKQAARELSFLVCSE
ncbi:transcription factor bHLH95-like [Tripterygium wilfordii]|uniref:Transcription factor bHLH95-like n=1 Tax=Tripterygium wilfordii TaxID=458696 RepID=A0A7J7DH50_TRIWF|nr:transcription factor bHLH95-like [Tripterygium wilfordii]KAF5745618.1 transcription factor bHLH95-like [Tripterygium wilfordii]